MDIVISVVLLAAVAAAILLKNNKQFKEYFGYLDEAAKLAQKAKQYIPQTKLTNNTLKVIDIVSAVALAADPELPLEKKKDLIQEASLKLINEIEQISADKVEVEEAVKQVL